MVQRTKFQPPLGPKRVPNPVPVVTKWFIAKRDTANEPYDDRIFDTVDDAHKAQDELGPDKAKTYIHSFNKEVGGKALKIAP